MNLEMLEIIGVYEVVDYPSVHLIELRSMRRFLGLNFILFTQEDEKLSKESWQVAYDEKYLNSDGSQVIEEFSRKFAQDIEITRLTFFLHYIDFEKPLLTPFGPLELPSPLPMPLRLSEIIRYEEVD